MSVFAFVGLGLLIGAVLGALGGGGAILTVPALVYLLGQTAHDATTSSLVIVGLTAVVGMLSHITSGDVRWRTGIAFGATGIVAALAGSMLNQQVDQHVLLIGFAIVMVITAAGMLRGAPSHHTGEDSPPVDPSPRNGSAEAEASPEGATSASAGSRTSATLVHPERPGPASKADPQPAHTETTVRRESRRMLSAMSPRVLAAGVAVGFLTGFFGVGGGFVIVPALVLALGLPMQTAIGTSLLVIAINSAASLAARAGNAHFDWELIVPFTLAAMVATTIGKRVADRVPNRTLSRAFAVLLLAVAGYTGIHSAIQLADASKTSSGAASGTSRAAPRVLAAEAARLHAVGDVTDLDVRTPDEFETGHIEGAFNLDVNAGDCTDRVNQQLVEAGRYLIYGKSGNRSAFDIGGVAQGVAGGLSGQVIARVA